MRNDGGTQAKTIAEVFGSRHHLVRGLPIDVQHLRQIEDESDPSGVVRAMGPPIPELSVFKVAERSCCGCHIGCHHLFRINNAIEFSLCDKA